MVKALYIYNLFPKLYKNVNEWIKNLSHIKNMGFNAVYINPFHYPGFSGSIYAPKDYYEYNPNFFTNKKNPEEELRSFIEACKRKKILPIMDLVVNHTSIDSPLIKEHKNWYVLEKDGEVKRPGAWENGKFVTWGDLATFDLDNSPDRDNLWKYLLNMCFHYLKLGFRGFRCDAAYQVSHEFWQYLISNIKKEFSDVVFLAETLSCTPVQIQSLSNCGFDYIFNSSKWWNFNDSWCLEQYNMTRTIAPSISFPETHDTARLMEEVKENEIVFKQRLYFEAIFSKGFMITSGFEYGFKKKLNTVTTTPADWENTGKDYSKIIRKILDIKSKLLPLHEESPIYIVDQPNWMNVFCFIKEWDNVKVLIVLNKDVNNSQNVYLQDLEHILNGEKVIDYSPEERISGYIKTLNINLKPGELKILVKEKDTI